MPQSVPTDRRIRTALFATHPIQYQAPWFRALAALGGIELKVYFGMLPTSAQQGIGFGRAFHWDVPLLDGYEYEVLQNRSTTPALGQFSGCDTPDVGARIRAWAPEVAILTGWQSKMLVQAALACLRLRVPRIIRGESNALRRRIWWKRRLHALWLRGFDQFLAIGTANRDFYRQAGVPERRIQNCPYFVDNERFAAAARELRDRRMELRRRWAIPDGAICFLYCGKLTPKKRPLDLLHALERAIAKGAQAHLLIVGEGELMEQVQVLVQSRKLPATCAGFLNQTEIVAAYVAADCLVLPSDAGETWGLVVNEAMACDLPALVSDQVGCGPDLVADGETGAMFPMGDVEILSRRLHELASDPVRLGAMGKRAQRLVCERYSVERAVAGTMAAIEALRAPK